MKKVLIGIGVFIVVIIAAAIAAPFFIPVDTIKDQIVAQTKNATGRELRIGGPVKLSLFPSIAIEVNQVAFANAQGASAKDMVTLSKLQVGLKVMPLISGEIAVDQFVLVDPVINLEVDANGRPNWQFASATQSPAAKPGQAAPAAPAASGDSAAALSQLRLGDVRLENGTLSYRDAKAGTTQTVEKINLKLRLPAIDQPFDADGSVNWNAKTVKLTARVANLQALLVDNKASDATVKIASEVVNLDFAGSVKTAPPLTVSGTADLNVPSVRNLAAWTGNPIAMQGDNLGPLLVKGKVAVNGAKYAFTDATVNLDAIKTKGSVEFDGGGAKPYVKAALDVEMLDLNPYLPPEQTGGQAKPAASAAPAAPKGSPQAKPDDWSDDPIDLSGMRAADADLALGVGGIKVRKIEVGRSALKIALKGGRMTADLTELNLYEGKGSGQVVLDGSGSAAGLQSNFKLAGLQIAPLLTAAADLGMVTGKGAVDLDITSKGGTQRQLVSALNGKGGLKLNDGTVKGIDFVRLLCNPTQAIQVLGGKMDPNAKTDFSEMGLTYTVTNGLLRNQDLAVLAPLFRADGSGTVDLPKRTINYRATPKLVASCSGQGGDTGKVGLGLPVVVEGPWSNVSVRPDFNPMDILKSVNPADALKDPKGALKGLLPGTGGTQSPPAAGGQTQQQPAQQQPSGGVGGALKGLLGR